MDKWSKASPLSTHSANRCLRCLPGRPAWAADQCVSNNRRKALLTWLLSRHRSQNSQMISAQDLENVRFTVAFFEKCRGQRRHL
jgi:hypothetical protein